VRPGTTRRQPINSGPIATVGKACCQGNRPGLLCHINLEALSSFNAHLRTQSVIPLRSLLGGSHPPSHLPVRRRTKGEEGSARTTGQLSARGARWTGTSFTRRAVAADVSTYECEVREGPAGASLIVYLVNCRVGHVSVHKTSLCTLSEQMWPLCSFVAVLPVLSVLCDTKKRPTTSSQLASHPSESFLGRHCAGNARVCGLAKRPG